MIEVLRVPMKTINESELPPVFERARHFAVITRVKGRDVLQFRYRVNGKPFASFRLNEHLLEMLEDLATAKHENLYALSERSWRRLLLFAASLRFLRNKKKIKRLKEIITAIGDVDLLYWYSWLVDSFDNILARNAVIRAFLTFFRIL